VSYGKIVDYAPHKNIVKAGREGVGAADCSSFKFSGRSSRASRFTRREKFNNRHAKQRHRVW